MCGHKMPVSGEESETEDMASENGESAAPEDGAQELAFKNKYKELKNRLKYLVYVSRANSVYVCQMFDHFPANSWQEQECYELELRKAEQTLLELTKDKRWLINLWIQRETTLS